MKISENGITLIKQFEGCRLNAYKDAAGIWTIGYGHTGSVNGVAIHAGMTITQAQAEALLKADLQAFEAAVSRNVTVPLKQQEFDALVSFTYNLGEGNLRSSTLLKKLNANERIEAAMEFPRWNMAGGRRLLGLARRRYAEGSLFLG